MSKFVEMFHSELDAMMTCPELAVPTYEELGWERVDEAPAGNGWEEAEEDVSFGEQDETSDQEDY